MIAEIAAALNSIKVASDLTKLIKESITSLKDAEVNYRLAEVVSNLANAKMEISNIQQALIDKDAEIRELREQLSIRERLAWDPPCYWLDVGGTRDGPFCQQCYDKDGRLIRLQVNGPTSWHCRTCNSYFKDKSYTPPPRHSIISRGI